MEAEYSKATETFRKIITQSKEKKWKEVCAELNTDPWGIGYQLLNRKFGANMRAKNSRKLHENCFRRGQNKREQ